jgi:hypothetical protein
MPRLSHPCHKKEHNVVAYLIFIFLYSHNGGVIDDNTVRQYIIQIKGKEESRVAAVDQQVGG